MCLYNRYSYLTNTCKYKNIELVLDKTSKIKLIGDSYVTKLTNSDSSNSNIDFNGHKLYVNRVAVN